MPNAQNSTWQTESSIIATYYYCHYHYRYFYNLGPEILGYIPKVKLCVVIYTLLCSHIVTNYYLVS